MRRDEADAGAILARARRVAVFVGIVAAALSALGAYISWDQFVHSYLVAYLFWLGLALGGLGMLLIYNLTKGIWGAAARPFAEALAGTLPLLALLFLVIAVGIPSLYVWDRAAVAADALLQHKQLYLNRSFFPAGPSSIWQAGLS